eukprot:11578060-Alexandrium_andersonii.AAC.1
MLDGSFRLACFGSARSAHLESDLCFHVMRLQLQARRIKPPLALLPNRCRRPCQARACLLYTSDAADDM